MMVHQGTVVWLTAAMARTRAGLEERVEDLMALSRPVDEQALVVGCVSRFQRRKRNDVAIDAMAHLDGDVRLVMAGEGEEPPFTAEELAKRMSEPRPQDEES